MSAATGSALPTASPRDETRPDESAGFTFTLLSSKHTDYNNIAQYITPYLVAVFGSIFVEREAVCRKTNTPFSFKDHLWDILTSDIFQNNYLLACPGIKFSSYRVFVRRIFAVVIWRNLSTMSAQSGLTEEEFAYKLVTSFCDPENNLLMQVESFARYIKFLARTAYGEESVPTGKTCALFGLTLRDICYKTDKHMLELNRL
jgi:hypothetical protein